VLIVWGNALGFPVGVDFQTAEPPGLQPVCLLSARWGGTVALQPDARTVCAVTSPR
jgi:two-component sensor histidine kinase